MPGPGTIFQMTSKPPIRDIQGRFAKADDKLLAEHRKMMRRQGRRMKDLIVDEAPEDTGEFKRGIRWQSFTRGSDVGFKVTTPQPLGRYIVEGTRPHVIPGNPILAFDWPGGPPELRDPETGMYFFGAVNHPGTEPNPFVGRAYRRWLPGGRQDMKRVARTWARFIAGARNHQAIVTP